MKSLYLTILYLEIFIWILVPIRHFNTRFFWFFLFPALSGVISETIRLIHPGSNTALPQFTLMTLGAFAIININRHRRPTAAILIFLFYCLIVFTVYKLDFGWQYMLFGRAVVVGYTAFEIMKLIINTFNERREFNIFHFMLLTFFTNIAITNLVFGLSGEMALSSGFSFFNLFVSFFYGLYFILFRENFSKFIFKV